MPLYLLARKTNGYDEYDSVLVRAPTEMMARGYVAVNISGDQDKTEWLSCPCTVVAEDGSLEIIIGSFNAG